MQHPADGVEGLVLALLEATPAVELAEQLVGAVQEMNDHRAAAGLPAGLLVEADDVSRGIAETRSHLRRVRADRLDERASVSNDGVDGRGHAVPHDVDEQAGLRGRRPAA